MNRYAHSYLTRQIASTRYINSYQRLLKANCKEQNIWITIPKLKVVLSAPQLYTLCISSEVFSL